MLIVGASYLFLHELQRLSAAVCKLSHANVYAGLQACYTCRTALSTKHGASAEIYHSHRLSTYCAEAPDFVIVSPKNLRQRV